VVSVSERALLTRRWSTTWFLLGITRKGFVLKRPFLVVDGDLIPMILGGYRHRLRR